MCKATDAELVARMRAGDESAFEAIVERHRGAVVARTNARLGSLADAEDVAQEAFVQAYFHLDGLRDPNALLPWLRRVSDRLALMQVRSRREDPVPPQDIDLIAHGCPESEGPCEAAQVESILAQLPEAMRETVSLTFLAGYTCAEAAAIMGVREGTVKSRLNRARAKLREVLSMSEHDITGGPTGEFTRRTVERLKREARRLIAVGNYDAATKRAETVLREQVKPLYGDPEKLGVGKTLLAAFDSGSFKPDEEAVAMLGLSRKEQRRRECEANARQYGFDLAELDWQLADVDMMSETLGKPTGEGRDIWGVPVSRMDLDITDARELCQRLRLSPLVLYEWVTRGCPILRCWPFARFDARRVRQWLVNECIDEWPEENRYELERPIRVLFREVHEGRVLAEQAETVMRELGFGVWWVPVPRKAEGGW